MGNTCQTGEGEAAVVETAEDSTVVEAAVVEVADSTSGNPTFEHRHETKYARAVGRHHVTVMSNPSDYIYAFVPMGKHPLNTLVLYPDVQPKPAHVVIKNFTWDSAPKTGVGHGKLTLPDFNGHVPTQMATPAFLAWYGCNFAEHAEAVVEMHVDHEIMDFNYNHYKEKWVLDPKYGPGSLGIERHEFLHMECALEHLEASGHILLGKINEEEKELYLTAFKVPRYQTLYMAPYTIHSNDHQLGLWRTMLSTFSEAQTVEGKNYIDHALIKDKRGENINLKFSHSFDPVDFIDKDGVVKKHNTLDVIENKLHSAKALATKRVGAIKGEVLSIEDSVTDDYLKVVKRLGHGHSAHTSVVKDQTYSFAHSKKSAK